MTPQQIVGMAVRLFAIWLVVIAFQTFAIARAMNAQLGGSGTIGLYIMPALPLVLAVLLWFFPMFVAHKIVPRTDETNTLHLPAHEMTAAASAIMGIWVLLAAIPHLAAAGSILIFIGENSNFATYFNPERKTQFLSMLLQCGLGAFLVARPWFVAEKIFPGCSDNNDNDA